MLWRRTSASQHIAVTNFAQSALPLVFKFVTKNFMSRGADIAFLSVCVLVRLALQLRAFRSQCSLPYALFLPFQVGLIRCRGARRLPFFFSTP